MPDVEARPRPWRWHRSSRGNVPGATSACGSSTTPATARDRHVDSKASSGTFHSPCGSRLMSTARCSLARRTCCVDLSVPVERSGDRARGDHVVSRTLLSIRALAAALVGGLTSVGGAFVAGLLIGLAEAVIAFESPVTVSRRPVAVFVLVLVLIRPAGLRAFGVLIDASDPPHCRCGRAGARPGAGHPGRCRRGPARGASSVDADGARADVRGAADRLYVSASAEMEGARAFITFDATASMRSAGPAPRWCCTRPPARASSRRTR